MNALAFTGSYGLDPPSPAAASLSSCPAPYIYSDMMSLHVPNSLEAEPEQVASAIFPILPRWAPDGRHLLIGRLLEVIPNPHGNDFPCLRPAHVAYVWRDLQTGQEVEIGRTYGANNVGRIEPPAWQPSPNPVMLVHGIGSNVDAWGTGPSSLRQYLGSLYGRQNVLAFNYGDEAPGTSCRAQGDIDGYASKIAGEVRQLVTAARSESGRDDLKVDFIVHSMGGLVVRRYLQTEEGREFTGRVVFLHTPHQGSYLESVQGLQENPVTALLLEGLSTSVGRLLGLDFDCPAHQQMRPGSGLLTNLNRSGGLEGIG